jgi:penicillin-binding protein 2B
MQEISDMKLPGIIFIPDIKRTYPLGDFASHIVGITNFDGKGISGIEKEFSKELTGSDGYIKEKIDKDGFRLPTEDTISKPPTNGNNIYTTLDIKIQTVLENSMNNVIKEYNPDKIVGIVMDSKTGEILALSNRPSIYPSKENEVNYINYAISYPFEPGSTMKIFTLASAINEGVYKGNEKYMSGSIEITGETIGDHNNNRGWGEITFDEGVQHSSNVAFAIMAKEKIGFDRFYNYLQEFGFDKTTGIDLSNEKKGKILYNYPIEKVTTSFGQGSTGTPIQLVTAASSIANDGKMMKPYIIKKITDNNGKTIKENVPRVTNTPISEDTAKKTRELLSSVVNDGTGKPFKLKDFQVAGKTGTAQIPDSKGYYQTGRNNYIFSFLGMAPAEDPRLIVYVAVEKPNLRSDQVGANPVSEIFNTVMDYGLKKLDATADNIETKGNKVQSSNITLKGYENKSVKNTVNDLKGNGLEPIIIGQGDKIIETAPAKGTKLIQGSKVLIKTSGEITMPNLKGWSLSDVMEFGRLIGLEIKHQGEGFVNVQSIAPGEEIIDQILTIKLN